MTRLEMKNEVVQVMRTWRGTFEARRLKALMTKTNRTAWAPLRKLLMTGESLSTSRSDSRRGLRM